MVRVEALGELDWYWTHFGYEESLVLFEGEPSRTPARN
jgi:hypothetical protein